jgi:hypothetical protein
MFRSYEHLQGKIYMSEINMTVTHVNQRDIGFWFNTDKTNRASWFLSICLNSLQVVGSLV